MFENPRTGREARYFITKVPKILDLKSSSERIFSENWRWVPLSLRNANSRGLSHWKTDVIFLTVFLCMHQRKLSTVMFQTKETNISPESPRKQNNNDKRKAWHENITSRYQKYFEIFLSRSCCTIRATSHKPTCIFIDDYAVTLSRDFHLASSRCCFREYGTEM